MGAGLSDVTFHNKLGSQADRIDRIAALAREIAPLVGADADMAEQAARVAKADLRSGMVGEFPELQGVMGRYYALKGGYAPEVADACRDHYSPLGPSDDVPTAPVTVAVALADKLDTLTGFWAIDEKPTGSKDPFALRRAALGVIRLVLVNDVRFSLLNILASSHFQIWLRLYDTGYADRVRRVAIIAREMGIPFDDAWEKLKEMSEAAEDASEFLSEFSAKDADLIEEVKIEVGDLDLGQTDAALTLPFFHDRLKVYLRDQGIRHDVIDACLAMPGNDDLTLLVKRAEALSDLLKTDDGENLLQGFKRANNILTQAEEKDGVEYSFGPDPKLADTDAEHALFTALDQAEAAITPRHAGRGFRRRHAGHGGPARAD